MAVETLTLPGSVATAKPRRRRAQPHVSIPSQRQHNDGDHRRPEIGDIALAGVQPELGRLRGPRSSAVHRSVTLSS